MNERTNEPVTPTTSRADGEHEAAVRDNGHARGGSVADLIRDLTRELTTLVNKEISLARAEFRETATEAKSAVGSMAAGGAIAFAGLVVLLLSAVFGLANIMPLWLAALIVGLAAAIVGYGMISSAKKKVEPGAAVPDRTVESVKEDSRTVKRAAR